MRSLMHHDWDDSVVTWEGYDSCIVGVCVPAGPVVYDIEKMIRVTLESADPEMTRSEALEYLDFNVVESKPHGDLAPPIYIMPWNPR